VTVPKWALPFYLAASLLLGFAGFEAGRHHNVIPVPPGPPPVPTPTPISGTLWVTLVYDGDNPGTDFARMEADPALEEGVNKLGGHLRKFTKDSRVLADKNLDQFVTKYGVPTLIIQAEGVSKVYSKPCPKTAAEVVDAARGFKEGKL
jgi:hypothetical protein